MINEIFFEIFWKIFIFLPFLAESFLFYGQKSFFSVLLHLFLILIAGRFLIVTHKINKNDRSSYVPAAFGSGSFWKEKSWAKNFLTRIILTSFYLLKKFFFLFIKKYEIFSIIFNSMDINWYYHSSTGILILLKITVGCANHIFIDKCSRYQYIDPELDAETTSSIVWIITTIRWV